MLHQNNPVHAYQKKNIYIYIQEMKNKSAKTASVKIWSREIFFFFFPDWPQIYLPQLANQSLAEPLFLILELANHIRARGIPLFCFLVSLKHAAVVIFPKDCWASKCMSGECVNVDKHFLTRKRRGKTSRFDFWGHERICINMCIKCALCSSKVSSKSCLLCEYHYMCSRRLLVPVYSLIVPFYFYFILHYNIKR